MDTALELLIKHDYFVKIQSIPDGVTVTFPTNTTMDHEQTEYEYHITEDGVIFGYNKQSKRYAILPDCIRLAILCDIIVKCNTRGIKRKLIVAYDQGGNQIADVLGVIHTNPTNTAKEEKLFHLVSSRHLNDNTKSIAEKEGMLDEYNDIVAIYNRRNGLVV